MHNIRIFLYLITLLLFVACTPKSELSSNTISNHYFDSIESGRIDKHEKIKYVDTLYHHLIIRKNDSTNRKLLFKTVREYLKLGEDKTYFKACRELYKRCRSANDTVLTAKSLYFIGDYYENQLQIDSAFKYYLNAEKLYRKINDSLNIGRTLLYKSGILYDAGIFTESESQTTRALEFLINTKNNRLIYESYNLMALNLKELNSFKGSLKYFNLALNQLDILEKENYAQDKLIKSRASIYNNMGSLYEKMKEYHKAIELYQKGLYAKEIIRNEPRLYAMLLNNLACSKIKLRGNDKDVKKLLFESLRIREANNFEDGIVNSKISIGEFYLHKKDTSKAVEYFEQGFELAKKIESSYDIKQALKLLSVNHKTNHEHYNALYMKVSDSLQVLERNTRNHFARIAYETNQIEKKNEFLSQKNKKITIGTVIIVSILGSAFIIYRLKSQNRELLLVKKQNEANEKIYQLMMGQQMESERARLDERNRIAMELHDGIVNRIFTTRFNLMQLQSTQDTRKEDLVKELAAAEVEIRKISHDLQQNLFFVDDSFQKTIKNLIENQQNEFNTEFDLVLDNYIDWSVISSENKVHIYRIIQEALQNINKYAKAKKSDIMLLKTKDKITIRISDDGVGFNPETVKHGIGLKNIKQRTEALKGKLKIISDHKDGTLLEIIF